MGTAARLVRCAGKVVSRPVASCCFQINAGLIRLSAAEFSESLPRYGTRMAWDLGPGLQLVVANRLLPSGGAPSYWACAFTDEKLAHRAWLTRGIELLKEIAGDCGYSG